jgi:hypothetical protein
MHLEMGTSRHNLTLKLQNNQKTKCQHEILLERNKKLHNKNAIYGRSVHIASL